MLQQRLSFNPFEKIEDIATVSQVNIAENKVAATFQDDFSF